MKSANASPGGAPSTPHAPGRSSESRARLASRSTPSPSLPAPLPSRVEEPRTGVVRVMNHRQGSGASNAPARSTAAQAAGELRAERARAELAPAGSSEWRCLEEWSQASKERRSRRSSKVTIVQLSKRGDLIRQNGPDAWLPEAGDFIQRMSRLVAHGLGFERCRSLCLKGASSVLTVTEAGDTKVVAVTGPARSMANVLRRAGLE